MTKLRIFLLLCTLGVAACAEPSESEGPDASVAGPDASTTEPSESTPDYEAIEAIVNGACTTPRACSADECGMVDDGCRAQMWCGECPCDIQARSCERSLTRIWEHTLTAGTHTIVVTQVEPASIDAVLHVIDAAGNELAWDDNSAGGTRPQVTVTVPAGQTRIAVLRPKTDTPTGGVASVNINGSLFNFGVRGRQQSFWDLRVNEEIETIQLPGSAALHVIYAMSADGQHITRRATNNGTAGGAVLTQEWAGFRQFWIGTRAGAVTPHPAALIRNDRRLAGHDPDGDGLGTELETAIGTCTTLTGWATSPRDNVAFPCSHAVDPRDTDGDGLSDGNEVRGIRSATPHQPLRRWGASPRHKDMFAEVDGAQRTAGEAATRVTPAQARLFSDVYGDRLNARTASQSGNIASTLRNPDNRPGITTHLDIGVPPETAADYTVYGNWGGYTLVPPSNGTTADPLVAWRSYLASSRVATFRYGLIYDGRGGQTSTSDTCPGCGAYAWSSSDESGNVIAHESGHANAIAHSGPAGVSEIVDPFCKPNWPSIMSYAYQNGGLFVNPSTGLDEVRPYGFTDGSGFGTLNNVGVAESGVISPWFLADIERLRKDFNYKVENGNVDWNRDGVFAPFGTTVRAYTNFDPGNNCEYTRYNAQWIATEMNTTLSPALGRLGNRTFMFAGGQTQLRHVSSTSDFDCAINLNGCGSWGSYGTFNLDTTRGVDAARVTDSSGRQALLIVGADSRGWLNSTMRLDDGTWAPVQWSGMLGTSAGEPAVETLPDGRALAVFKQSDGTMLYGVFRYTGSNTGSWERWGPAMDCATGLNVMQGTASPGLARTNFTGVGSRVWGLFSSPAVPASPGVSAMAETLAPRSFNTAQMCFSPAELPMDAGTWTVQGRPAGVWVPDAGNAMGGRLTIIATNKNDTDPDGRFVMQAWSYADPVTGERRIGQRSGFDSGWTFSYGVDGWFDPGIDDNMRVVWSVSPKTSSDNGQRLRFFPRADGINDFAHVNYNDFEALRFAVCRNVVNPTGNASNPIVCPPRPW